MAESEWALSRSMAGNTGNCDDPDAPEGAYAKAWDLNGEKATLAVEKATLAPEKAEA